MLPKSYGDNSLSGPSADAAIASSRGLCVYGKLAHDHAVLDLFCGTKSLIRPIDDAARAARSGTLRHGRVAKAHAVLDMSWDVNSEILLSAWEEIAFSSGS